MSPALLVGADGSTVVVEQAAGNFLRREDRWFRFAGVARNRNTTYDGQQFTCANGPPNKGHAVYLEVTEPCFAPVRVVEVR